MDNEEAVYDFYFSTKQEVMRSGFGYNPVYVNGIQYSECRFHR